MNLLICGACGQLGSELKRLLSTGEAEIGPIPSEYSGCSVVYSDLETLDITDKDQVDSFFEKNHFDVVINCAAFTNVDKCEEEEDLAYRINALGPRNLAVAAQSCGSKLIHVSTDYVFSGSDSTERTEDDETCPVSAYGRTKLAGERFVLENCSRSFIVRTAWLYGYEGNNFVKTMLRLADSNGGMVVVDDQFGNPTSANDLAYEILKIAISEDYGIYHVTNNGTCSWFDFAQLIVEDAGFDRNIVKPCSTEEYSLKNPCSAKRPFYSSLRNKHLEEAVTDEMRPWQEALKSFIWNLTSKN